MKDQSTAFLISVLGNLVESLEATALIAKTGEGGAVPDSLQSAAAQLSNRLSSANRMATGKYLGSAHAMKTATAACEAIRRLDVAFVAYRRSLDGSAAQKTEGVKALEAAVARVRNDSAFGLASLAS